MRQHKNIIVTLMWNKWSLTERLLEGLRRNEAENIDEIHIVDNGSEFTNEIKDLEMWSKYYNSVCFDVYVHRIESNIGFTLGANYGLQKVCSEMAEKKLVFLISNDVQINGPFIRQAEDILLGAKRALVGNRHIDWNSGWNVFDNVLYDYLEGYFLAATSDGWRDLNYFDVNYAPMDYEDVDLSTTAKKKGYKLVSLNNPNIVHFGAGTYGYTEERRRQTEKNREIFKKKWGADER